MPSWPIAESPTPSALVRRIAAYTPSGTATPRATIVEAMTSGAVTVSFSPSWLVTVEPVSADSPKSPVRTPPIHSKYWVSRGRSSPRSARISASRSGVTSVPAMTTARSPGTRRSRAKTMTLATSRASTNRPSRRTQEPGHSMFLADSAAPSAGTPDARRERRSSALHGDVEGVEAGVGIERRVARTARRGPRSRRCTAAATPLAPPRRSARRPAGAVRRTPRGRASSCAWPSRSCTSGLSYSQ